VRAVLLKDAVNDQTVASVQSVAAVTAVVVAVVAVVKAAVKALLPKAAPRAVTVNAVNAPPKGAPKVAVQSAGNARSVQPVSHAQKTAMKAAAKTPAKPSRAMKVRAAKAVVSATAHAVIVQNVLSVQNAVSAFRAMLLSRIWPWPIRLPWLPPWAAMLRRVRTDRPRTQAVMASAASQVDVERAAAMKPALKDVERSHPAKADVNAASARVAATSAVANAPTALPHRLPVARLTVSTPPIRLLCWVWTRPEAQSHRCHPPKFRRALKARKKARNVSHANAAAVTAMAATAVSVASRPSRAMRP
jgi:hypothetical protein